MPSGRRVTIAGLVLVRQRPGTGNAIFMTLEDETAVANAILWPRTFEQYRPVIMGARLISVTGMLQNEKGVIHIVAEHFEDLSPLLRSLSEDQPKLPQDHSRYRRTGDAEGQEFSLMPSASPLPGEGEDMITRSRVYVLSSRARR